MNEKHENENVEELQTSENSEARIRKTNNIMIEQSALERWRYHRSVKVVKGELVPILEELDLYDAALIHHVHTRLTIRPHQDKITHENTIYVWVHYPTVRRENWLLQPLGERALKQRFAKLVRFGILIRKQVPRKTQGQYKGGSKAYFGISEVFKESREEVETKPEESSPGRQETERPNIRQSALLEGNENAPRTRSPEGNENAPLSLSEFREIVLVEQDASLTFASENRFINGTEEERQERVHNKGEFIYRQRRMLENGELSEVSA